MSKIAEQFAKFGLQNMTEAVRTFYATGKTESGKRVIAEITIFRVHGSTEVGIVGPYSWGMRVGSILGDVAAPTYDPLQVQDWKWKGAGYQSKDEDAALESALANFELWHLDTPHGREMRSKTPKT